MFKTIAVAVGLVVGTACSSNPAVPDDDATVIKEIETYRTDRDTFMRQDPESPIPPDKKTVLLPLPYYPPNPAFAVPAVLNVSSGTRPVMEVPTSKGVPRRVELVGNLEFTLNGQKLTLGAFVEEGTRTISSLVVPFADLTTGEET